MLPSLLEVLSRNKHHEYPQNIFEASTLFYEGNSETNITEKCWLGITLCNQNVNFTSIKQILDYLMSTLGIEYKITEKNPYGSHVPTFIEGRTAYVTVKGKMVAWLGEVHPQVLSNFGLELPVASLELNLSQLFELL